VNERFFERAGGLAIAAVLVIACLKTYDGTLNNLRSVV
jgi:hypothetical protein